MKARDRQPGRSRTAGQFRRRGPARLDLPSERPTRSRSSATAHPVTAQLRRKADLAHANGVSVVATSHAWGWSRWLVGPSAVTRQTMYITEPGLTGIRLRAAAAIAKPDLRIKAHPAFRPISARTLIAALIALWAWLALTTWLPVDPWLNLTVLVLAVIIRAGCSRPVLTTVAGQRLRIVEAGSARFNHLSHAAELLDGLNDSALRWAGSASNSALWSAATAGPLSPDAPEGLARRVAALRDAAAKAEALTQGHEISQTTWIILAQATLDHIDEPARHTQLSTIAEQLRQLDQSAATDSGIDADQILAEAATSRAAAAGIADALSKALQDTATTHHAEGLVDQLVESTPTSPDASLSARSVELIEAYRVEINARATGAEAAITALHHSLSGPNPSRSEGEH